MYATTMFVMERLIAVIAPFSCIVCGNEGRIVCDWCRPEALETLPSRCYSCHVLSRDSAVCPACRKRSPLCHVWIASSYEGYAKRLVEILKFERGKAAAEDIAHFVDETLPHLPADTIVVHVPTATSRRRQRGYDQSEEIARQFARLRGLRHRTLLARMGHTRQVGSSKKQRQEQIQNAFRARNNEVIKGSTLLLIDDLTTTGSTLEAAARMLKRAGAKKIIAATFAQKL